MSLVSYACHVPFFCLAKRKYTIQQTKLEKTQQFFASSTCMLIESSHIRHGIGTCIWSNSARECQCIKSNTVIIDIFRRGIWLWCRQLIPALHVWAARAWYTTWRSIATQFPGHGWMDDLTTKCSFDLHTTWMFFIYVIYECLYNQAHVSRSWEFEYIDYLRNVSPDYFQFFTCLVSA